MSVATPDVVLPRWAFNTLTTDQRFDIDNAIQGAHLAILTVVFELTLTVWQQWLEVGVPSRSLPPSFPEA